MRQRIMSVKRFLILAVAIFMATIGGTMFAFRPSQAAAMPDARYVALGDSVAAGAGLLGGSDYPTCGRSNQAYPTEVAASLQLASSTYACGGATAKNGLYKMQTVGNTTLTPQLDAAFAQGTPQVLTITIGANDVHWSDFVKQCYATTCGTRLDKIRVQAYLLDLRWRLYRTLSTIEDKSGDDTPPQVVLTGYYDPVQGLTCAALPGVTPEESVWLSQSARDLNNVIRDAATWFNDFATYAPVDFSQHGLCSTDSWVQSLTAPAPAHPTAAGQHAIAQSVITTLNKSGHVL